MDNMFTVILIAYIWFSLIRVYVDYKIANLWYQYDLMLYITSHYMVYCYEERLILEVKETRATIKRELFLLLDNMTHRLKGPV